MKTKSGSSRALLFLLPVALAFILMFAVACGGASTYTVTFDLNYSGAQNESVTVEDGDKVTLPPIPSATVTDSTAGSPTLRRRRRGRSTQRYPETRRYMPAGRKYTPSRST